jgi:hypothetical protein
MKVLLDIKVLNIKKCLLNGFGFSESLAVSSKRFDGVITNSKHFTD